eukprot:scaffold1954_cov268-Pinguiococcus_pyrenoidosus.AAC.3
MISPLYTGRSTTRTSSRTSVVSSKTSNRQEDCDDTLCTSMRSSTMLRETPGSDGGGTRATASWRFGPHCWSFSFGFPGSANDIVIFRNSPFLTQLLRGGAPRADYVLNGKQRSLVYITADGIYPEISLFWKGAAQPQGEKQSYAVAKQEALRKMAERGFGVLKAQWKILQVPFLYFQIADIEQIAKACVILHNMMVEERRESSADVGVRAYMEYCAASTASEGGSRVQPDDGVVVDVDYDKDSSSSSEEAEVELCSTNQLRACTPTSVFADSSRLSSEFALFMDPVEWCLYRLPIVKRGGR